MSQHDIPERLSSRAKGFGEDGGNQTMEVLVETLTGTAFEMTVSPSDTVLAIKSKIYRVEGIPVSQQHLVHNLQELEDSQSLGAAGVRAGSRLRLVLGLRGGPVGARTLPHGHTHREEEWVGCLTGCRVAVVILRDGERVRVVRVGGDTAPQGPPEAPPALLPVPPVPAAVSPQDARTMTKMAALRKRLEDLSLRRRPINGVSDIHKTRSEETFTEHFVEDNDPEEDDDPVVATAYAYRLGDSFADSVPPSLWAVLRGGAGGASGDGGAGDAAIPQPPGDDAEVSPSCAVALPSAPTLAPALSDSGTDRRAGCVGAVPLPRLVGAPVPPPPNRRQRLQRIWDMDRALRLRTLHQEHEILEVSSNSVETPERVVSEVRLPSIALTTRSTGLDDGLAQASSGEKKRLRCAWCRRRVTVSTVHRCLCGAALCPPHRYREAHHCTYDYNTNTTDTSDTLRIERTTLPRI